MNESSQRHCLRGGRGLGLWGIVTIVPRKLPQKGRNLISSRKLIGGLGWFWFLIGGLPDGNRNHSQSLFRVSPLK